MPHIMIKLLDMMTSFCIAFTDWRFPILNQKVSSIDCSSIKVQHNYRTDIYSLRIWYKKMFIFFYCRKAFRMYKSIFNKFWYDLYWDSNFSLKRSPQSRKACLLDRSHFLQQLINSSCNKIKWMCTKATWNFKYVSWGSILI